MVTIFLFMSGLLLKACDVAPRYTCEPKTGVKVFIPDKNRFEEESQ